MTIDHWTNHNQEIKFTEENYTFVKWPEDTSKYIKAFQVRHPLERFLSSYRFMFERESMKSTMIPLNRHIFETYPDPNNNNMTEFNQFQFVPTFKQFSQFVVDSDLDFGLSMYAGVSHWLPYYMSCNPCHSGKKKKVIHEPKVYRW